MCLYAPRLKAICVCVSVGVRVRRAESPCGLCSESARVVYWVNKYSNSCVVFVAVSKVVNVFLCA